MMRTAGNTVSPISDIQRCVTIRMRRESTAQTSEHRLIPKRAIPFAASRAGERRVSRTNERHRHADQWGQQQNALREEFRTPLPPRGQRSGILKCNTSARSVSTAHQLPGFFGLRLSRSSQRINLSIVQMPLLIRCALFLFVQDRAKIRTLITVTTHNGAPHAHVTADPFRYFLFFGHWDFYPDATVPFLVLPEDFALFTERGAGISQCPVDSPVFLGRDVELPNALHHHPQIKSCGRARGLDVRGVDQFRVQRGGGELTPGLCGGLETSPPIRMRPAIGSPGELPHASRGWDTGLLHSRNGSCGVREQPLKQPRQESQRIRLGPRRKQFELIPEGNLRRHGKLVAKRKSPRNQEHRLLSAVNPLTTAPQTPVSRPPAFAESVRRPPTVTLGLRFSGPMLSRAPLGAMRLRRKSHLVTIPTRQAKSWELRTTTSLARLWQQQGKQREAHDRLAEIYNWFTEGFDTKDLQEAKALIEELSQ